MAPYVGDFENLKYNPFENNLSFKNDDRDPDVCFFNELNNQDFDCSYFSTVETANFLRNTNDYEYLNTLHVNIRSLKQNIDSLKQLLDETNDSFNIICLSETWCKNNEIKENSTFHINKFKTIPFERKLNKRGGGVLIYVKENITYNFRNDLSVSNEHIEILTIEIINKESKNIILFCVYKPPTGDSEVLSTFLQNLNEISSREKKKSFYLRRVYTYTIFFIISYNNII